MGFSLVTAPTIEPVSLAEAKAHMRVDFSDDDDLITALVVAARQQAENHTNRVLLTQTWDWTLDRFPCTRTFEVPRPPLQSVSSITYKDTNGDEQTFSSSKYLVDTGSERGRISLADGESWPATKAEINAVTIRFIAGYGDTAATVPQQIRQAILMMVGHLYEHRESVAAGVAATEVPFSTRALLGPYEVIRVG